MGKTSIEIDSFRCPAGDKLPILGQLMIVTTVNREGNINAAIKSDLIRMVTEPPIIGFSCNLSHHTAQNIIEQHEFVVNIPGEDILPHSMECAKDYPVEINELDKAELTPKTSSKIDPPCIAECLVNIECKLESYKLYDDEIIVFGKVISVSIDEDFFNDEIDDRFRKLRPIVLVGEQNCAIIKDIRKLLE